MQSLFRVLQCCRAAAMFDRLVDVPAVPRLIAGFVTVNVGATVFMINLVRPLPFSFTRGDIVGFWARRAARWRWRRGLSRCARSWDR